MPTKRVLAKPVYPVTFWFFIFFTVDFFLHLSARIPGYGLIRPTLLLVGIICCCLLAQYKLLSNRTYGPVFLSISILIVYIIASWPFVEYPGSVIRYNLANFIKAVVFFFFSAFTLDTPRRLKIFLRVFICAQIFRVMEPLYLNITTGYWGDRTHLGHGEFAQRLAGSPVDVINPNELGFVIATAVTFLHFLVASGGFKGKLVYFMLLPPMLYALVLTMSRGAMIALFVVLVIAIIESKHKFMMVVVTVGMVAFAITNMSPIHKDRYLSLVGLGSEASNATAEGRRSGMIEEFELGFQRPIVGHGVGTTPEAKVHIIGSTQASHSLYAELFIEIGMVGSLIFYWYLFTVVKSIVDMRKHMNRLRISRSAYAYRLSKTLYATFVMYAVYSVNYWGLSQYYWYLFAGLVYATHMILRQTIDSRSPACGDSERNG